MPYKDTMHQGYVYSGYLLESMVLLKQKINDNAYKVELLRTYGVYTTLNMVDLSSYLNMKLSLTGERVFFNQSQLQLPNPLVNSLDE